MEYISTSALATAHDLKSSDLFDKFKSFGWIERKDDKWILTELGKQKGGQMRSNPKYGDYVVWPENLSIESKEVKSSRNFLSSSAIGEHFRISGQRMNLILSELGWTGKDIAGWKLTKLGQVFQGKQMEHDSGNNYVVWPSEILSNKHLLRVLNGNYKEQKQEIQIKDITPPSPPASTDKFREKFPATLRTKDGHMVRSRAEVIIDNSLYDYKLLHAYERKLPIEEDLYSDFYIPNESVYIEYWGMENDPKYLERKEEKKRIYNKYGFNLIELNDEDISNLDDYLPKKLLKYGIKVY